MKANFKVDPDFPIIDGVGHSDKIDFFDVKGGGCTNTTMLDMGYGGLHLFSCSRDPVVLSTNISNCRVGPNIYVGPTGVLFAGAPDCLNCAGTGDTAFGRGSDRVLLNRVEVSGVLHRAAGTEEDDFSSLAPAPKVFVALVLDTQANGAAIDSNLIWQHGGAWNGAATNWYSNVILPFDIITPVAGGTVAPEKRFRFLAHDVVDFALNPETSYSWVDYADTTTTEGGPLPVPETTTVLTRTRYSFWRSVALGFRFDVDLNDALCQFSGDGVSVASCSDLALHVFAYVFDGVNQNNYTPHAFGSVSISYMSRVWFSDFLSATHFVAAGADGGVVPDEEVPLAVLADQSALMAGDGTFLERPVKRTKASHGFYNFRPRSGDAMLFEDDPEFARLHGRKGSSRARVSDRNRRALSYRRVSDDADEPVEPFQFEPRFRDDFDGAEPPRRRGKF